MGVDLHSVHVNNILPFRDRPDDIAYHRHHLGRLAEVALGLAEELGSLTDEMQSDRIQNVTQVEVLLASLRIQQVAKDLLETGEGMDSVA